MPALAKLLALSGLFSLPAAVRPFGGVSSGDTQAWQLTNFLSWNAQTLCHRDKQRWKTKLQFVFPHVCRAHVSSFQELHGDEHEMQSCLLAFHSSHHLVLNPHATRGSGGTAVLISFAFLPQESAADIVNNIIVPGRVQRTAIMSPDQQRKLVIYNIHNYGLSDRDIETVRDYINSDRVRSIRSPREYFVLVNGDFNFMAEGELPVSRSAAELVERERGPSGTPLWILRTGAGERKSVA